MTEFWESLMGEVPQGWWYRYLAIPIGLTLLLLPIVAVRTAPSHMPWRNRFLLILAAQLPAVLVWPTTLIAWKPALVLGWLVPSQPSPINQLRIDLAHMANIAFWGTAFAIVWGIGWRQLEGSGSMKSPMQRITKTFTAISTRVMGMRRGAIIEAAPFGVFTIQSGIRNGMIEAIRPNAIIGTHGDIPLPDESVSRRHAQIHIHGNTVMISDLGSRNGTFLGRNQQTIPLDNRLHPLQSGDQLILGDPASASAIILTYHQEHQ